MKKYIHFKSTRKIEISEVEYKKIVGQVENHTPQWVQLTREGSNSILINMSLVETIG